MNDRGLWRALGIDGGPLRSVMLVVVPVMCLEACLAGCRQVGVPSAAAWYRRFASPNIAGDVWVGEVFTAKAGGLSSVTVHAVPGGTAPSGEVVFKLREMSSASTGVLTREGRYPVARVLADTKFSFEFAPVSDSFNRRYRLEVSMPEAEESTAIRLLATRQKRTGDTRMVVRGAPEWADLLFRTAATRATVASRLAHRLEQIDSTIVWSMTLLLLIAAHSALGFVLASMTATSPRRVQRAEPDEGSTHATRV